MAFNTLDFIIFFFITVFLYFAVPAKYQIIVLLLSSYVFYAYSEPKIVVYLLLSTLVSYYISLRIQYWREKNVFLSKRWLITGICIFALSLSFFKYTVFFIATIAKIINESISVDFSFIVPLGISFIVFTVISYLVDVYNGKTNAESNFIKYALFVSFFPKIIQGPIVKANDLLGQFDETHSFDLLRYRKGMIKILYGLFLKMVVADNAGIIVNTIYGNTSQYCGSELFMATVLFAIQLYCDFSGYSNVSIGTAYIMGFEIKSNFRQPYFSSSVSEFWKRWHISLNRWLTDYIYIPLGGSRVSKGRKYYNILITFFISGLWHGSAWGYIIWGLLNGIYVILENEFSIIGKEKEKHEKSKLNKALHILLTFILVSFSWIFFRSNSLSESMKIIKTIFGNFDLIKLMKTMYKCLKGENSYLFYGLNIYYRFMFFLAALIGVFFVDIISVRKDVSEIIAGLNRPLRWGISFVLIFSIMIFGVYGYGYSAESFIYTGF